MTSDSHSISPATTSTSIESSQTGTGTPTSVRGESVSDVSTMLGAFSIVTFWAFGVGIALGVAAVLAAIAAVTGKRAISGDHTSATTRDAAMGAGAGIIGILAGYYFLSTT